MTLPIELQRAASLGRIVTAKSEFSKACVGLLRGMAGSGEHASACMDELSAARAALALLDAER